MTEPALPAVGARQLVADLRGLGVEPGDALFVHSSFRSLGPVAGGAGTVVAAFEEAVGDEGLILMPSFNLGKGGNEARAARWDRAETPSTVGWLTEFFRCMPGTVRSDHYSHSVAARGRDAEWFVAGHRSREGMRSPWDLEPWGTTYGANSPMIRAYDRADSKILMLGVDYRSSTFCHVVETKYWNHCLENDPSAEYYWIDREKVGAWWDSLGRMTCGKVGQADCRLFGIREFVDTVFAAALAEPGRWFKWYKAP